ncbi:MAG: tetratricopeptide repeat protein [Candidatus Moduliflexus flocculans]|nr:tetratricopeptide repeat protein [Candidatus Moduliflexus flocculans]
MVNTSMAYARMGENDKAEQSLQKALKLAPDNAAANFNMGLLKAEKNELKAGGEVSQEGPEGRSPDGAGRLQPLHHHREGPHQRSGDLVPEGVRPQTAGTQVCLYPCLLSESEGRQGPRRSER